MSENNQITPAGAREPGRNRPESESGQERRTPVAWSSCVTMDTGWCADICRRRAAVVADTVAIASVYENKRTHSALSYQQQVGTGEIPLEQANMSNAWNTYVDINM